MKTKVNNIESETKSIHEALDELFKITTDPEVINLLYYIRDCNNLILKELK
jgi:hypothetical protein